MSLLRIAEGQCCGLTAPKEGEQIFQKWTDTPGFKKFSDAIQKIVDKLDPNGPFGKKVFGALDRASMKVVELVDKFADSGGIDKFGAAITYVLDNLDKVPAILDSVVKVSEVIAAIWAGSKIVGAVTSLVGLFPALATGAGTVVGAIAPLAAPLLAVAAAAGSVYFAFHRISETVKELGGAGRVWKDLKDWVGGERPAIANHTTVPKGYYWDDSINGYRKNPEAVAQSEPAIASQSTRVQQGGARVQQSAHNSITINAPSGNADEIAESLSHALPGATQQSFERMSVASGVL